MSSKPIFTTMQPDGTSCVIDLSTPGPYQDFAFEAAHADGRRDRFAAYHTGERAILTDVLTRLAARRPSETILADITRIRHEVAADTEGPWASSAESMFRPAFPSIPEQTTLPFSNSYTID